MAGVFQTLVAASFCWFLASSIWIFPHSLAYVNESIGGSLNGPKHLLGRGLAEPFCAAASTFDNNSQFIAHAVLISLTFVCGATMQWILMCLSR